MPFNLPIALTWLRIAVIPVFVALFYIPESWVSVPVRDAIAAWIFIAAAITDWADGWLARRWKQTSAFGAFLDPVADKLMVAAALLVLLKLGRVDSLIALVIIGREIAISALREWMAQMGASASVAVHWLGKFKTAAQMVAIPCLLYKTSWHDVPIYVIGQILIVIAALLTVWSMFYYLKKAWPTIRDRA
ncbi:CDP-diacylglycerol--glycerol-3-phosphate 3-phosphatidyltransferase [Orrella sp. 11846]|uniref:CDP-diacylglycerol--glycerol-3-phosphate 3-phosphatidyltransferase n=1 Tax=Orrella sp. 11846 TaxID=3409913 RepID=UPI003B5BB733